MPPKKPAKHDAPATNGATMPKASTPTTVSLMNEPLSPPASSTVTTRAASTHDRTRTNRAVVGYQSPLKKLRTAMRSRRVIDTIDDLRDFIENTDFGSDNGIDSIRIHARLLWVTSDTVRGRRFLRMYLGEHQAPEPLQQQQKEYQAFQAEDPFQANKFLITVSLLEVDENDPRLPAPGAIVSFTPFKLHLYRDCCQADAKLQAIKTVDAP